MKIYIDIDNTIFKTNKMDYNKITPITENIVKVNKLYDKDYDIIMWTARGTLSNKCFFDLTYNQLKKYNVKFHELRMGKPAYDLLIDDKALNSIWNWNNESSNSILNKKLTEDMIIIIQARTGSTRLPNKVLLPFYKNKNILDIICERLSKNKYYIPVCINTTNNSNDDILYNKYKDSTDILCYRGDENNVLSRFIDCAEYFNKKTIIRVCSDNPFLSLKYMEYLIDIYLENNKDYISYSIDGEKCCMKSHIGIFSEIVSLNSLKTAIIETKEKHFLENVTEYIYENPDKFSIKFINNNFSSSIINDIRLTLDTQEDFNSLVKIYKSLDIEEDIDFYQILNYLHENKNIINLMCKNIKNNLKDIIMDNKDFVIDNKNILYKEAKKSNNASLYLRENSMLDKSKIIEMSYDIQSGNYINLEENKYFCDVYEYFSNKICNFINKVDITNYSILEIGCGEGNLFYRICKNLDNKYSKSYGLDLSVSRLMFSKKICEKHQISNYSLMACDMNNLPLEDNSIDFLVTCHAIEPNGGSEEKILKELYRVTSKYLLLIEPQDMFSEEQKERMRKHNYIGNIINFCEKLNYDVIHQEDNKLFFNDNNKSRFIVIKKNVPIKNKYDFVSPISHNKLYSHMNHNYDKDTNIIYPIINDINIFTSEILCNNFQYF